jgi:thymidylate synthase
MIKTEEAYEAWKKTIKFIFENGKDFFDENSRKCREVMNLLVTITKPEKNITGPISRLNSFDDWKYPSFDEISHIMLSPKVSPDYSYSYGSRIFNFHKKIDQLNDFVIPLLSSKPSSRRAVISFFDPTVDSNPLAPDTPGLLFIDLKIRGGKLNLVATIRSNDFFFGWPANVYQLFTLQKYVAERLNVNIGFLTTFSISAHIFENQFEYVEKIFGEK